MSGERSGVKYIDDQCLLRAVYKMEDSLGVSTAFYSLVLLLGLLGSLPTLVLSSLLTPPRGDLAEPVPGPFSVGSASCLSVESKTGVFRCMKVFTSCSP